QAKGLVPHHLIDVVDPDEPFGLAQYQNMAYAAVDDVHARGSLPLLVGGSGQYVRAVLEGWGVPRVPPDQELRDELYRQVEEQGGELLHARLCELDPVAAERIDPRNVRRVIRALEVCLRTGERISDLQRRHPPPYHILQIGLTMPREALYRRIDERVDRMMSAGLVIEVQSLVEGGYDYALPSMSGLGYRQIGVYLRGEITLQEAVRLIKRETRRFVRQQYNWFRLDDERIHWFSMEVDSPEGIEQVVRQFVGK
ncbi:MAG: tRNA (adenosine(37)-N6)-dimethylallyltransferase MiaA, partial [Chloroflexota bacterium]|nr:tRNA (adenosine(37)-N6)-dimethylallyltransferase MiaA [Chloroflexota bacterium]